MGIDTNTTALVLICLAGSVIVILLLVVMCFQLGLVDRIKKSHRTRSRRSKRETSEGGVTQSTSLSLEDPLKTSNEPGLKPSNEPVDTLVQDEFDSSPEGTECNIYEECLEDASTATETGRDLNTSIYLYMNKSTRDVSTRSSNCVPPGTSYLVDDHSGSSHRGWTDRHRSVPVARCPPLWTNPEVEIMTNEIQRPEQERIKPRLTHSVCEPLRSPLSLPPRPSIDISDHDESFGSAEDLFKGGWWKSTESLNKGDSIDDDVFKDDDLTSAVSQSEDKMAWRKSKQSLKEDSLKANSPFNGDWRLSKQSFKGDLLKADGTCNRDWLSSNHSLKVDGFKTDNIFTGRWWESKESLKIIEFENEDIKFRDPIRRKSFSGPSCSSRSVYVYMKTGTSPDSGRSPPEDKRRRSKSLTLPDVFKESTGYQADLTPPSLSVWYPPDFTESLQSPPPPHSPPKPCTSPNYVNFRGTLPNRF
ncbi:uncharacterized protein LOC124275430 [Haliotis rubra]|uniref:uncharacterized protein LOC124275430 n=1 Tax=Haliotis rubra TaxID=36100 RepID=UPI001EE625CB|nr:uncharacterized protein LOC124275430 [Haliotis rubra]XP_046566953.1 uncharacterized protein LOC124275430 [Haliotis rubra]